MMPVVERNLQVPGPIRLLLHGMGTGTPIIEIANHGNRLRLRRRAEEVCRLGHVSGRVTAVVGAVRRTRTHWVQRLHLIIVIPDPLGKRFHRVATIKNQNSSRSASGKRRERKIFLQQLVDKDVARSPKETRLTNSLTPLAGTLYSETAGWCPAFKRNRAPDRLRAQLHARSINPGSVAAFASRAVECSIPAARR